LYDRALQRVFGVGVDFALIERDSEFGVLVLVFV